MRKIFTASLLLAAALGLSACDSKSEQKAQDAQQHAEKAQEHLDDAAKHNAEANKDQKAAQAAEAQEQKTFTPESAVPESIDNKAKQP